jgi:myosin-crossreactive antigen
VGNGLLATNWTTAHSFINWQRFFDCKRYMDRGVHHSVQRLAIDSLREQRALCLHCHPPCITV